VNYNLYSGNHCLMYMHNTPTEGVHLINIYKRKGPESLYSIDVLREPKLSRMSLIGCKDKYIF